MKVTLAKADAVTAKADLLAVPVFAGPELGPGADEAVAALGAPVAPLLEGRGFTGKTGETAVLPTLGRLPATVLLLVGVGERAKVDAEALRRAAAAVVRQGRGARKAVTTLPQALPADPAGAVRAVTEGALLAAYRFDKYKKARADGAKPAAELAALAMVAPGAKGRGSGGRAGLAGALAAGQARAAATNLARDLSNEPANALHPADLAAAARKLLAGKGVTVKVKDEKELAKEGFGGIIGVGQGAEHPPRLIELRYRPALSRSRGAAGEVALIGKGITFDSGGLSLKPADSMKTMKTDMSGAAAVLAAMSVLAELDVKVGVTGYLASAENMPSGRATRPGDVLTMKNGRTVEVLNTDAEGRLVMADALALGAEAKPDAIIDVATLTGACAVALGNRYTGLMANDDALAAELLDAAADAGEPTWRLPLPPEYHKEIESDLADLKNVGDRYGGALVAGLFLQEFVDGRPWVHLDIAGPARAESEDGYLGKGSTGVSVRTLLSWLERRGAAG
ncbi:MAG TPA: leucyl aminopeptidase [Actinomycetes bacterium]|nr:leucyl aminopeptidase [Actinomycetes bacterium]